MSDRNLNSKLQEELKTATSLNEIKQLAAEEGCELSDEMLEGIAGGTCPENITIGVELSPCPTKDATIGVPITQPEEQNIYDPIYRPKNG